MTRKDPGEDPPPLDVVQRWFHAVVTHPDGIAAGLGSEGARALVPLEREELERMVRRSARLTAEERLSIYANAYYARLLECLGECFPVLRRALGAEVFSGFAFEYLQRYPSRSYTLDRLAESFPRFLAETRPDLDGEGRPPAAPAWPDFLIDLARLEWTVARVFDGPGVEGRPLLAAEDLRALPPDRLAGARLAVVPCLALLAFRYPIDSYYTAARRLEEGEEAPPVPAPEEEWLAVTRRDFVVRRYRLTRAQHALLAALQEGAPVGEALAAAAEVSDLDDASLAAELHAWFRAWAAEGLFASVRLGGG